MLYKAKLSVVLAFSALGALTVEQWTIIACLMFGTSITTALYYRWLLQNPQWMVTGLVVLAVSSLGLLAGHDIWIKRLMAVLLPVVIAYVVRALQPEPVSVMQPAINKFQSSTRYERKTGQTGNT